MLLYVITLLLDYLNHQGGIGDFANKKLTEVRFPISARACVDINAFDINWNVNDTGNDNIGTMTAIWKRITNNTATFITNGTTTGMFKWHGFFIA